MIGCKDACALVAALASPRLSPAIAQADLAAAKAEGKVVWYTSTPVETANKIAKIVRGADRNPRRTVPLRRLARSCGASCRSIRPAASRST